MSKYVVLGGYLGAGKTTGMIAFAEALRARGKQAAILVNDLGTKHLVDGSTTEAAGCCYDEVTGDCICYQTAELVDKLRLFRDSSGAEIIFSDIPGCGIGALDHVYHRLAKNYPGEFTLCPFTAVADPERLRALMPEHAELHLPAEMGFLFDAQLKEAELILLNKVDTLTPERRDECLDFLRGRYPQAVVLPMSARTGEGVDAVVDYLLSAESALPNPDIGYGSRAFAAAEKRLCWYDRKCYVRRRDCSPLDADAFAADLFEAIRARLAEAERNVPHLKLFARGSDGFLKASLLGIDYPVEYDHRFTGPQKELRIVLNARAACESEVLDFLMDAALREVCQKHELLLRVFFTECFGMMDEGRD